MEARELDLFSVLDSLAEGVTLTDMQGRIFFSNRAAHDILGVPATDAPPETWAQHYGVFLPDGVTPFPTERYTLVRALKGESTDNAEMLIKNANNPAGRLISTCSRSLRGPDGVQVGGAVILRDITAQRAAERMREELTALIIHDLKSPLTTIVGESDLLLLSCGSATDRESLTAIRDAGYRLNQMVLDLLDIHLGEDGALRANKQEIPLGPLLQEVRNHMQPRADLAGQTLVLANVADDLVAWLDPALVRRVLQNLVDNCVKYAGRGGAITIDADRSEAGGVRISVRDNGPGVPPELRSRIFEKYSSVERDAAGRRLDSRGLGLRFCSVAVAAHDGRVWVEDNTPRGASFCVELPGASSA